MPIEIKYSIIILNESHQNYTILLPAIILGFEFQALFDNNILIPLLNYSDFKIVKGESIISYNQKNNATMLNITSNSSYVEIYLEKDLDYDKYRKETREGTLYPGLNSIYRTNSNQPEKMGIFYFGMYNIDVELLFKMDCDQDGIWRTLTSSFNVTTSGFYLMDAYFKGAAS